jgi:hypothetical protein
MSLSIKVWGPGDEAQGGKPMRKWYVPVTVVGVGALGVLALAVGGRPAKRWLQHKLERAPQTFQEWNEAAQQELDRLQSALDDISAQVGREESGAGQMSAT